MSKPTANAANTAQAQNKAAARSRVALFAFACLFVLGRWGEFTNLGLFVGGIY
jgi:hypothetical protein